MCPYQVETEEVEDLPGVILLQDLLEGLFDEAREALGGVLQGVAHEAVEWGALGGVAHQGALLPLPGGGRQDAGCYDTTTKGEIMFKLGLGNIQR